MIDEKGLVERLEMLKRFLFHDECGRQTISVGKIIDLLKNAEKSVNGYLVSEELTRANKKNPLFHSDHEAYGVIDEEAKEMMDEAELIVARCAGFRTSVHRDYPRGVKGEAIVIIKEADIRCACEAVQVAAMCEKWVMSNENEDIRKTIEKQTGIKIMGW